MTAKRLQSLSVEDVNLMSDAGHPDSTMVSCQGEQEIPLEGCEVQPREAVSYARL